MHGPKGSEWDKDMYSAGEYKEIVPMEKLVVSDYFSDENGNKIEPKDAGMSGDFPSEMDVTVTFEEVDPPTGGGKTRLSIVYTPQSEEVRKAMLASGMEEGWSTSLDKLAASLKQ